MKIKKRYIIACVLLCVFSVVLSILMFNVEMGLARYSKLNKVMRETWSETSAVESIEGRAGDVTATRTENTNMLVTKVRDKNDNYPWTYLGSHSFVDGKCTIYDQSAYITGTMVNGKPKTGDKISIYYKPDDPMQNGVPVSTTVYIVLLSLCFAAAIGSVVACRFLNKSLAENTFSDSVVNIMDIPILVMIIGVLIGFFAGMYIGSVQIGPEYTEVNQSLVEMLKTHEATF